MPSFSERDCKLCGDPNDTLDEYCSDCARLMSHHNVDATAYHRCCVMTNDGPFVTCVLPISHVSDHAGILDNSDEIRIYSWPALSVIQHERCDEMHNDLDTGEYLQCVLDMDHYSPHVSYGFAKIYTWEQDDSLANFIECPAFYPHDDEPPCILPIGHSGMHQAIELGGTKYMWVDDSQPLDYDAVDVLVRARFAKGDLIYSVNSNCDDCVFQLTSECEPLHQYARQYYYEGMNNPDPIYGCENFKSVDDEDADIKRKEGVSFG